MTGKEILEIALRQSAVDSSCAPEDFLSSRNAVFPSTKQPGARNYLALPHILDFVSYGHAVVASGREALLPLAQRHTEAFPGHSAFEAAGVVSLARALAPMRLAPVYDGEYLLPDPDRLQAHACPFPLRVLEKAALNSLYRPEWSNALCEHRRELDVLAVGAYDGGRLVGLAGCSADCEAMWQIGVDVLPEYRRLGIAKALTSRLALEALRRERVPFYCCGWANVASARNALACGFRPAWAQLTVKPVKPESEARA